VSLSRSGGKLRVVMTVADASKFQNALVSGAGTELLIATRFASDLDVFWVGMRYGGQEPSFVAGRLGSGLLVDTYAPDDTIPVTGSVDEASGRITMEVPFSALKTKLQKPEGVAAPTVSGFKAPEAPAYSVTGFSFVGVSSIDDDVAKHLLDVTPSFTLGALPVVKGVQTKRTAPKPPLPATGADGVALGVVMLATALASTRRLRFSR